MSGEGSSAAAWYALLIATYAVVVAVRLSLLYCERRLLRVMARRFESNRLLGDEGDESIAAATVVVELPSALPDDEGGVGGAEVTVFGYATRDAKHQEPAPKMRRFKRGESAASLTTAATAQAILGQGLPFHVFVCAASSIYFVIWTGVCDSVAYVEEAGTSRFAGFRWFDESAL